MTRLLTGDTTDAHVALETGLGDKPSAEEFRSGDLGSRKTSLSNISQRWCLSPLEPHCLCYHCQFPAVPAIWGRFLLQRGAGGGLAITSLYVSLTDWFEVHPLYMYIFCSPCLVITA